MTYLFQLGHGWEWSKIYFDEKMDTFVRERYHEEYLDTGTICEGSSPISDIDLWRLIVEEANESGINKFLEIRGIAPRISSEKGISPDEFCKQLYNLKNEKPYFRYSVNTTEDVSVFYDENKTILGVLSQAKNYWFFINQEERGFHTQEEALEFILNKITDYHERRIYNANLKKSTTEKFDARLESKSGLIARLFKK